MQFRTWAILIIILCGAIITAGCTGITTSPSGTTPGPGTTGTPSGSGATAATLTTVPTDTLPSVNDVTVDVSEKDYLGIITVTFQGGLGMNSIKQVTIKLTRADGSTQETTVGTRKGDQVELQGTRGTGSERGQTDRVEVWVATNQLQTYRIVDVLREYRTRG